MTSKREKALDDLEEGVKALDEMGGFNTWRLRRLIENVDSVVSAKALADDIALLRTVRSPLRQRRKPPWLR
jgi:hypothetical protein